MLQKMAKITYILNLKGRTLQCAQALINSNVELSYAEFMNKFRCVFVKRTSSDSADIAYSSSNKENKVLQITPWILLPEGTGREETVLCGALWCFVVLSSMASMTTWQVSSLQKIYPFSL